jgi:nucleoside-diphosphate-sugar epimerase
MTPKRIFITGASGSTGHYITDTLIRETNHELFLLLRDPARLRLDTGYRSGINLLQGDLKDILSFAGLLKTMNVAVLTAVDWGGTHAFFVNVAKTLELLELLDPAVCEQALYFSTASILNRDGRPIDIAGEIGTDYVRSKYDCLQRLPGLAIAPRLTVLFPTVVLGGDAHKPHSFLSEGLPKLLRWVDVIRFFRADGSFHIIHGQDTAQVVRYLIDHPPLDPGPRSVVLGQQRVTFDQAVEEVCAYLDKRIYFRMPIPIPLMKLLLMLVQYRIPYRDRLWDRFCLDHRHFSYANPVNPGSLGLPNYCATLSDLLRINGIPHRARLETVPGGIPQADGSEDHPR